MDVKRAPIEELLKMKQTPSTWRTDPGVRKEMERQKKAQKKKKPRGRPSWQPEGKAKSIAAYQRAMDYRYRITIDLYDAYHKRLPCIMMTCTFSEYSIDRFLTDTSHWNRRQNALRKRFKKIDPSWEPRWCWIMEEGETTGRRHLHGILTVTQPIAKWLGDPAKQDLSHSEIAWFKQWWRGYGYCTGSWIRFSPSDYLQKDMGFMWPARFKTTEKGGKYRTEIKQLGPEMIAGYLSKYLSKAMDRKNGVVTWRTKTTRGYGEQEIALMATKPLKKEWLEMPEEYLKRNRREKIEVGPSRRWARETLVKYLLGHGKCGQKNTEVIELSQDDIRRLSFGKESPVRMAYQTIHGNRMREMDSIPIQVNSGIIRSLLTLSKRKMMERIHTQKRELELKKTRLEQEINKLLTEG